MVVVTIPRSEFWGRNRAEQDKSDLGGMEAIEGMRALRRLTGFKIESDSLHGSYNVLSMIKKQWKR